MGPLHGPGLLHGQPELLHGHADLYCKFQGMGLLHGPGLLHGKPDCITGLHPIALCIQN